MINPAASTVPQRLLYDSHMHTPLCKHARGEPGEYAAVGYDANLAGIIFTCHNPLPAGLMPRVRMAEHELPEYLTMVEQARQHWVGRLDVRLGLECDHVPGVPGLPAYLEKQAGTASYDYLLGSIHPHLADYQNLHWFDDPVRYQKIYFDHLVETAELGLFDCLSHPDLVRQVTLDNWDFARVADHVGRCLDRIARTGIAMELNTSGWRKPKTGSDAHPVVPMLELMRQRNIPVVLGSDSHRSEQVGYQFTEALKRLEQVGYTHVCYYIQRKQHQLAITDALASLGVQPMA